MAATKEEIAGWVNAGKLNKECTHVIIVCDTFDWEDYPVEVKKGEDIDEVLKKYALDMQKVMEVYSMEMALEPQLDEARAYHPHHK